jgi:hypothetical protein
LAAAAEALRCRLGTVVAAAEAAWQQQLRGIGSATSAAVTAARQRNGGGGGCGDSFPPTHAPSNATDTPTYAPLSLVEDRGTAVLIASLSATAAPVATSSVAATAQTKPKATLTIPFVKQNTLLN